MTDLLSIGASGLRAYRDALGTTSDNIANAQTAGYVRRTVRLEEAVGGGSSPMYVASVAPGGVLVDGIQRSIDQWLVEDSRVSISNADRSGSRLTWLGATERALNEGPYGVGSATTSVFNSADSLAADPSNLSARMAFIEAVATAAGTFRGTAEKLNSVASGIADAAAANINQVNSDVAALNRVNEGLLRAREGSTSHASLLDERDRLLDSLAGALPIKVSYNAQGAAAVSVSTSSGSLQLLNGPLSSNLSVAAGPDGRLTFALGGTQFESGSGSLAGLRAAADTNAEKREQLDQLASQFANELNSAHQSGYDSNGNPGQPLLSFSGSALSLVAAALSPSQIAAAGASSDNANVLAMSGLRGMGGVEQGWTQLAAVHAQAVASATAENSAASSRREGALQARGELSGVDLDREAAELLRFQQAYEASARVIQVAREAFQSILNAL